MIKVLSELERLLENERVVIDITQLKEKIERIERKKTND